MDVFVTQIYVEPSACFPFSHVFQLRLSAEIAAATEVSAKFIRRFGEDFKLSFRMSAKHDIASSEVRGPAVYKRTRSVEYAVFLPFDAIMHRRDAPEIAVRRLLADIARTLETLEVDTERLKDRTESIVRGICSDPAMLAPPAGTPRTMHHPCGWPSRNTSESLDARRRASQTSQQDRVERSQRGSDNRLWPPGRAETEDEETPSQAFLPLWWGKMAGGRMRGAS